MKIMQIHKFFYPHAGSETVLFNTRDLLLSHGHDVIDFSMQDERNVHSAYSAYFTKHRDYSGVGNSRARRVEDAITSVYSPEARRKLRKLLVAFRPDVAHLHLIYHQMTLSVIDELATQGVPIVMTAHDYKPICPAYTMFRDGKLCTQCAHGSALPAVRYRCVKGSLGGSALAALESQTAKLRHTYRKVNVWVAPSAFAGAALAFSGVAPNSIRVIPNFLPVHDAVDSGPVENDAIRFLFAGRLETTKGVDLLVEIFARSNGELGTLVIAGAGGALENHVRDVASDSAYIEYIGRVSRSQIISELLAARAAVLPSRWPENNPMSVLEAQAAGRPVVCSDSGGLPDMVTDHVDGIVVPSGSARGLADALRELANSRSLAARLGLAARRRFDREGGSEIHYSRLMEAYGAAMSGEMERP